MYLGEKALTDGAYVYMKLGNVKVSLDAWEMCRNILDRFET